MHGIIFGMQQYFTNEELELNQLLKLDENTVHHITNFIEKITESIITQKKRWIHFSNGR